MSALYNFQQNFKSYRDFQQNFLISMKPVKYEVLQDVSMPDMVVISHIFAFGQLNNTILNIIMQVIYIISLLVLGFLTKKKLKKYQDEVKNQKTIKDVSSKIKPEDTIQQTEGGETLNVEHIEVQKEKVVPKWLLLSISLMLLAVNSLFQSVIEAFFTAAVTIYLGESQTGVLLITLITVPLMVYHMIGLYKTLKEQIPKERNMVNEEGIQIQWTEATYQADIEKQNSPYKGMFKPYKSDFPYFELVIMFLKAIQIFATTVTLVQPYEDKEQGGGNKTITSLIALIGQILPLVFIIKKKPYNYDGENKVNMFMYALNIAETIFIWIYGSTSGGFATFIAWVIRLVFYTVPIGQAILYKKLGPKQSYNMSAGEKEFMKKLEFTSLLELGHKEDPIPIRNWIVFNEDIIDFPDVRNKIWQNYWNNSFQYLPQFSGEHQEEYNDLFEKKNFTKLIDKYPKFLCEVNKMTTQIRFVENRKIWNELGEQTYKNALKIQNDTQYLLVRQNILLDVQEYDVHDGYQFGYLQMVQFPFIGLFVADEAEETTEFEQAKELEKLAQFNCTDHRITLLKMKRKCFRTLNQFDLFYPHIDFKEQVETVGHGLAAQEYYIHGFLFHNYGKGKYNHTSIEIFLYDGVGATVQKDEVDRGKSQTATAIDNSQYKIFPPTTHQLMFLNKNNVVRPYLPKVYENQANFRKQLTNEYYQRQKYLTYHFNANITANRFLKAEQLQEQLNIEQNENLHNFMQDEYSGTTYKKTIDIAHDPSRIYQHFFYSDIWKKNYDTKSIKKQQITLDPSMQDFIGYEKFENREEHEQLLIKKNLKKDHKFKIMQKFFNQQIMDQYYEKEKYFVDKYTEQFKQEDPVEVIETDKIIEYLKDPKTAYVLDTASEDEINEYIDHFQQNMVELFNSMILKSRNFWTLAEQFNQKQTTEYITKKAQTEELIRQLEIQLDRAIARLRRAQSELSSAKSNLSRYSHDDPGRYSAESRVSSAEAEVENAQAEVNRIRDELEFQRQVLKNIIEVLRRLNFNQYQYVAAVNMSNNIIQGQIQDYSEFVEYLAKNLFMSLTTAAAEPTRYTREQLIQFNIVRKE